MQPMHTIPARGGLNFDETPFLAIWEITQSCDLACKHCRAAAQPIAHPDELTTAEGKARDRPDRRDGRANLCIHRRRSSQAQRRVRADPLCRRQGRAGGRHAQRHALIDARGHVQAQGGRPGAAGHLAGRLHARDSRQISRASRRVGAHHPGHRVGQ